MTKFSILCEKFLDNTREVGELFINPSYSELNDCESGCRGIITEKGDLIVAQSNAYIHLSIHSAIKKLGQTKKFYEEYWDYIEYGFGGICVQRLGKTNKFYLGESTKGLRSYEDEIFALLQKAKKKNKGIELIPKLITSKKYNENFYTAFDRMITGYTEVFVNPNSNEIREIEKQNKMGNEIRILADNKLGLIFCFSSNITHYDVWKEVPNSANIHMTYYENKDGNWYIVTDRDEKDISSKLHKLLFKTFPKAKRIQYKGEDADYKN